MRNFAMAKGFLVPSFFGCVVLAGWLCSLPPLRAQYAYVTVDPPGSVRTLALAISGTMIVGTYRDSSNFQHGFLYSYSGTTTKTLDPAASIETFATAISGSTVAGYYFDSSSVPHGFSWKSGTFTLIDPSGTTSTYVTGISGTSVVGYYFDNMDLQHGFVHTGSGYSIFDVVAGGTTQPMAIDGTHIVGSYIDPNDPTFVSKGFLYNGSTFTTIQPFPLANADTQPTAISGTIVAGYYEDEFSVLHGFTSNAGTITVVDPPATHNLSEIQDISGTNMVGYYTDSNSLNHGFLFDGTNYTVLDPPASALGTFATGISGNNITGYYRDSNNTYHGFLSFPKLAATVILGNLTVGFTGSPQSASATTSPPGLDVTFTYNGSATAPSAKGSYTVVGTVVDPIYVGSATGTFVISSAQTFAQWETTFGVNSSPTAIPFKDGVSNLLKYSANIDPSQPMSLAARNTLPAVTVSGSNETLTYYEYNLLTGITVTPQSSPDLVTWTAVPTGDITQSGVSGNDKIMLATIPVAAAKQFMRLRITSP